MAFRNSPLRRHYDKIRAKKGHGVAAVAVAHKLVKSAFYVLTNGCEYRYRSQIIMGEAVNNSGRS